MFQIFAEKFPVLNINDVYGTMHTNPLGLSPLTVLIIILAITVIMHATNILIYKKGMQKLYPLSFIMLLLALAGVYYYAYMPNLPDYYPLAGVERKQLGWYATPSRVGWGWAIVGIIATAYVIYCLICNILQLIMNATNKANLQYTDNWNVGTMVWLIGMLAVTITAHTTPTASMVTIIIYQVLILAFFVAQVVSDARHGGLLPGLGMGIFYILAMGGTMVLAFINANASIVLIVGMICAYATIKARSPKEQLADDNNQA